MKPERTVKFLSQKLAWEDVPNLEELKSKLSAGLLAKSEYELLRTPDLVKWFQAQAVNYSFPTHDLATNSASWRNAPWWMVREAMRRAVGVYPEATEALARILPHFPQFCLHMSVKQPGLLAYTPSYADGMADKQVPIGFAKFLNRYYPTMPDHVVAELEALHRGELTTDDVILVSGEDIVKMYKEFASCGLSSCMTKTMSHNPIQVYAEMPEVKLAYLTKNGTPTARCLVIDSPTLGKRFIRNYGDKALRIKLGRMGFVRGGWQGLVFPAKRIDKTNDYVMPYLDANDQAACEEGSITIMIDGVIRGISKDEKVRYNRAFPGAPIYPSATGSVTYENLNSKDFMWVSPFSGKSFNRFDDGFEICNVLHNGVEVQCNKSEEGVLGYKRVYNRSSGELLVPPDSPTFDHGLRKVLDTEANRLAYNYIKLNADLYPDKQDWIHLDSKSARVLSVTVNDVKSYILRDDAVRLVSRDETGPCGEYVHKSFIDKAWIKLQPIGGFAYYTDDPSLVVKTETGRKVVEGVHEVTYTWDGKLYANRSTDSVSFMELHFFTTREEAKAIKAGTVSDALFAHVVEKLSENLNTVLRYCASYATLLTIDGYRVLPHYGVEGGPTPVLLNNLNVLKNLSSIWSHSYTTKRVTESKLLKAVIYNVEVAAAEAEALDYSSSQEPYTLQPLPQMSVEETKVANLTVAAILERRRAALYSEVLIQNPLYSVQWYADKLLYSILETKTFSEAKKEVFTAFAATKALDLMLGAVAKAQDAGITCKVNLTTLTDLANKFAAFSTPPAASNAAPLPLEIETTT